MKSEVIILFVKSIFFVLAFVALFRDSKLKGRAIKLLAKKQDDISSLLETQGEINQEVNKRLNYLDDPDSEVCSEIKA